MATLPAIRSSADSRFLPNVAPTLRAGQREDFLDDGIVLIAAAGERVGERDVEAAVADEVVVEVEGDHFP